MPSRSLISGSESKSAVMFDSPTCKILGRPRETCSLSAAASRGTISCCSFLRRYKEMSPLTEVIEKKGEK